MAKAATGPPNSAWFNDRVAQGIVDAYKNIGSIPIPIIVRLQGTNSVEAKKIIDDAKALENAGAFMILLEMVPDRVCKIITDRAEHCIIMSLGSGPHALHATNKATSGETLVAAASVRTPFPLLPFSEETLDLASASR